MDPLLVALAVASLILATTALGFSLAAWRRSAPPPAMAVATSDPDFCGDDYHAGPPAVIVNPSKVGNLEELRAICERVAAQANLGTPLWFETSEEDPGQGPTRAAVEAGAGFVVAVGGDGTVRQVATALANTGVPLGVVAMGTGNLLARNLGLPLGSVADQVTTAFTGTDRPMDVGWLSAEPLSAAERESTVGEPSYRDFRDGDGAVPVATRGQEHIFLVIGGLGFDAAMVAGANAQLKARIGWLAYSVTAVKSMVRRRIGVRMWVGGAREPEELYARTVMFANCGRLPGGVVLAPDAELDDGWLDIATIDTRGGLVGWASVGGRILLQGVGVRRDPISWAPGTMTFRRGTQVRVETDHPEAVQVDGDVIAIASTINARVERGALLVRT
ncbi:MAG: diacylglycerol kinase family protein [Bowdeniella nasicola]|nr:diacylglycerol kinase family protein [Bowdeniella nasicola]